jgi:hypothetical protein
MRRWIALFEHNDLSAWARGYSCVIPHPPAEAIHPYTDYDWTYDPAYPVADIAGGDWTEWMKDEMEMWAEEGEPTRYDDMFDRPIMDPIILVEINGVGWLWDGCHRVGAASMLGQTTLQAVVGRLKRLTEDFDYEGWSEDVDPSYEQEMKPERLPATPENIHRAKQFVMQKWAERHAERGYDAPEDLSNACKFTSLFARDVFGGRLRGSMAHQFVQAEDGTIIDLNLDAKDVKALGDHAHHHDDELFWGNPEHKEALDSCRPRVSQWVAEFLGR